MGAYTSVAGLGGGGNFFVSGFVGGVLSEIQGGSFGSGFITAGVAAIATPIINGNVSSAVGRVIVRSLIGGTVSHLTGGKFANGAVTAALQSALQDSNVDRAIPAHNGRGKLAHSWAEDNEALARLVMRDAEAGLADIRGRRYTDMDKLAMDASDILQPITDNYHVEVGARIFKNGDYFELGSAVSNGQVCVLGGGCRTPISSSVNLNGRMSRVVGYLHMHPDNDGTFSDGDLSFALHSEEPLGRGRHQTAYVSRPDRTLYSFNTAAIGTTPGANDWNDYINMAKQVR